MDLLQLVAQPTWREFLVELVTTQQMDPWDINLTQLADVYLARVRELQALDLRVPANVILASAILLYFKAQALRLEDEEEYDAAAEETPMLLNEQTPELVYRANRPRTRRVTLGELLTAMDRVLKEGPRKLMNAAAPKALAIELPPESMEERMARVLKFTQELKDSENVVLFSALVERVLKEPKPERVLAADGGEPGPAPAQAPNGSLLPAPDDWTKGEALVYCLLPVLHLAQNDKMHAWQDETFGEIFLRLN